MGRLQRVSGHLRQRRFRLYGVGNGKSGTRSLAQMFDFYRSGHEVDFARLAILAAGVLTGDIQADSPRVRAALRRRSVRFHLDVDVAGFLSPFAGTLALLYSDAKFVLLIRDCFSWLDSRVDHNLRLPSSLHPAWKAYFGALYGRYDDRFTSQEDVLRDAGLRPIASYLRSWADLTERVLRSVPADQLLVLRTEDLDRSAGMLARFAGAPASTVRDARRGSRPYRVGLVGQVPVPFVVEQAREYCGPLMERYWGADWCELRTRLRGGAAG